MSTQTKSVDRKSSNHSHVLMAEIYVLVPGKIMNIMKMKAVLRKKTTPKPDKIGKRNTMIKPKVVETEKTCHRKKFYKQRKRNGSKIDNKCIKRHREEGRKMKQSKIANENV